MYIMFNDFEHDYDTVRYTFDVYLDKTDDIHFITIEAYFSRSDFIVYDYGEYELIDDPIWNIVDTDIEDKETLSKVMKLASKTATKDVISYDELVEDFVYGI